MQQDQRGAATDNDVDGPVGVLYRRNQGGEQPRSLSEGKAREYLR